MLFSEGVYLAVGSLAGVVASLRRLPAEILAARACWTNLVRALSLLIVAGTFHPLRPHLQPVLYGATADFSDGSRSGGRV
jgi:hypothetical protein